jgi:hypothetical protein
MKLTYNSSTETHTETTNKDSLDTNVLYTLEPITPDNDLNSQLSVFGTKSSNLIHIQNRFLCIKTGLKFELNDRDKL